MFCDTSQDELPQGLGENIFPHFFKVENFIKVSMDSIPSPSSFSENSNYGWENLLECKGKTLLGIVNNLLKTKSLLTSPSNVLPYYLK